MNFQREITNNIFSIGAIDWDRRLFDELIPLPDGTSYNAYLIRGSEKVALIDTVDPTKKDVLLNNLKSLNVEKVDYIIANHAEQDHSGSIPWVLEVFPDAKVICSEKCKEMLVDLLLIPENSFITVSDGETLSLGYRTLEFISFPWVHWPETILTYLREDKILFPCDLFGSHIAGSDLFVIDKASVYEAAKRYFAEIMMPFRNLISNKFERIEALDINMIAPSHGPIYKEPNFIIKAYKEWISEKVSNKVIIAYVSMHGSTRKMVEYMTGALIERGITVKQFDLIQSDIGKIAIELVDAVTIIIGSPTLLGGAHPYTIFAAHLVNALRPKLKYASIIGSYSWGGRMVEQIKGMLPAFRGELLEPVIARGYPKEEDFKALDSLADTILEKHKDQGIAG